MAPSGRLADVGTSTLLITNYEWLSPYLQNVKKPEDLKKINLGDALHHHLSYEQQQLLVQLAPEQIAVPTGSKIKLQYFPNGQPPVLAVRLQEVFGLVTTPTINEGKTPVLMHLLSPGFKPVQVTADLESFWNNAYHEVRKELRRRYPKHEWPEDPWKAQPVKGVKRKTR